ncbi:mucin-5AC-like [Durio zibethinus]|uniref:Mucin-5AC-like n=1 Tax=Durio zibethinus TaxID=66656 RepID=A0A6P6ALU0_DURZI|nr:mucin-5AC-like [Durio zibethinus]
MIANYSISAKPSKESYAPAAAESENKSVSPESLPVLANPDSPTTEAETEAETLSPTNFSVPPSANIPDVETKSDETLSQENISTLSDSDEPTDIQTKGEENLSQELASSPSVNIDPTLETKGDENISTSLSPSNADNSVPDTGDMDGLYQENTSLPPSKAVPPAVETKESTEDLFQENTSLPPSPSVHVPDVETKEDENVSQENLSSEETKGNETLSQENAFVPSSPPSLAPAYADTPVLETSDNGSFTQENQSPVTYVNSPAPETREQDITTQDYPSATPPNTESQNSENLPKLNDYSSLPKIAVPGPSEALSFPEADPTIQMTPSNDKTFGLAPTREQDITTQDYPSTTPPNTESQNSENLTKLNDYSSLPKIAVPGPSEAPSFPEADPTIQMTPSNDETFGLAPTSHHTILPFNYRAEDEPVEPYEDEDDSWNGVHGAVAGVLVGACVVGVGGFAYQKRKKDNIRAQYECLANKGGV